MRKIALFTALLLFAQPAFADQDPSCNAFGDTVSTVKHGDVSINMACPGFIGPNDFLCDCHAPIVGSNKCRVYACNQRGEELPVGGSEGGSLNSDGPLKQADSPLSGYSNFAAVETDARNAAPKDELALGMKLLEGTGGNAKNPVAGVQMINDAAARGYAPAQVVMGVETLTGHIRKAGKLTNKEADRSAFYWFSKAAAQGDADGAARLGELYSSDSEFLEKNLPETYFWLKIATAAAEKQPRDTSAPDGPYLSNDAIKKMLADAKRVLSADEVAAVDAHVADWQVNQPPVLTPVKPGETTVQKQAEQIKKAKEEAEARRKAEEEQKKRVAWQQDHPGEIYPPDLPPPSPPPTLDDLKAQATAAQAAVTAAADAQKQSMKDIQDKAAKGDADASFDLGYIYLRGDGTTPQLPPDVSDDERYAGQKRLSPAPTVTLPQDFEKTRDWYKKAADKGNLEAQYNLGELYHYGRGIPKDAEEAFFWLSVAARSQQQMFIDQKFLDNSGLPADTVAALKQKALDWRPWPYQQEAKPAKHKK